MSTFTQNANITRRKSVVFFTANKGINQSHCVEGLSSVVRTKTANFITPFNLDKGSAD